MSVTLELYRDKGFLILSCTPIICHKEVILLEHCIANIGIWAQISLTDMSAYDYAYQVYMFNNPLIKIIKGTIYWFMLTNET